MYILAQSDAHRPVSTATTKKKNRLNIPGELGELGQLYLEDPLVVAPVEGSLCLDSERRFVISTQFR